MPTLIMLHSGMGWYTDLEPEDVKQRVENEELIPVWWFADWGQRYSERALITPEAIAYLRTESDDG